MSDDVTNVDENEATDGAVRLYAQPARITRALIEDDVLTAARDNAFDPSVFEGRDPFFFRAEISNNLLDSYFTRMAESTLRNFATEAAAGVAFQNSHTTRQLGFGRSLTGTYIDDESLGRARVEADFYTMPGLRLNDVSTDDFITAVKAGLVRDVSVGFYGGTIRCSVCGLDWFDWNCPHIFGVEYTPLDDKGKRQDPIIAMGWVEDAHLSEVSIVYAGACPESEIIGIKAQRESDAGRLRPETARLLEQRYRLHLPGASRHFAGASVAPQPPASDGGAREAADAGDLGDSREVPAMPNDETERLTPETPEPTITIGGTAVPFADVRSVLEGRITMEDGESPHTALTRLLTEATDGRQYRADLIDEALAEGVRAQGNEFATDTYRAILTRASLPEIKRFKSDWEAIAARQFTGGRVTVDGEEPLVATPTPITNRRPDRAYAS